MQLHGFRLNYFVVMNIMSGKTTIMINDYVFICMFSTRCESFGYFTKKDLKHNRCLSLQLNKKGSKRKKKLFFRYVHK